MAGLRIERYWALLIALQAAVLLGQSGAPTGVPGTIEGRVSNAITGEPIGGAAVHLYPLGRRGGMVSQAQTAAAQQDGIFRFESVPQGNYFLSAEASGFVTAGGRWRAERLAVDSGQQITGVVVQLNPQGAIQGKVLDENGRPMPGARVRAYATYAMRGRLQLRRGPSTSADKAGEYVLKNLNPGRYYLSAEPARPARRPGGQTQPTAAEPISPERAEMPEPGLGFVRTFYPGSLDVQSATPFEIVPGQPVAEANILLRRAATYQIRGSVGQADGAVGHATVLLSPHGTLDSNVLGTSSRVAKDGTFEMKGVLPGDYTLWLIGTYAPGEMAPRRHGGFRLLARQDVDVTASDLGGVALSLTPPVNLTGHVTAEGIDPQRLSGLRVNFVPAGQVMVGSFQSVAIDGSGNFAAQNLAPGEYAVRVNNPPAGTYVKEVSYNRQDITLSGLDLSYGGAGEIEVVIRAGAAAVSGRIQGDSAGSTGAAVVVLVPDNLASDAYRTLTGPVTTGTFAVADVPPGHYYAYALERWNSVWQNTDFLQEMQREGTSVDVEENGHAQVQLSLTTEQEVELTAARLGLAAQ